MQGHAKYVRLLSFSPVLVHFNIGAISCDQMIITPSKGKYFSIYL